MFNVEPTEAIEAPARRARAVWFARLAVVVALACAGGTNAIAAAADTADPAKAEELIREANDLRRHGHDGRALPLLRRAYEIARTARTAGQLGLAEMALGYWSAAEGHLSEAVAEARNPWVEKNRTSLDNALRSAQSHLGDVRIEGKPDGAEVLVNGSVVGVLPLANALRINEGRLSIEVRAPGYRSFSTSLALAGKGSERIEAILERPDNGAIASGGAGQSSARVVSPQTTETPGAGAARTGSADSGAKPPPRDVASDALPAWRRVLPWAFLGGALVAGGIGVWQQVESQNAQSSFDAIGACGASNPMRGSDPRCALYYDDYQSGKTHAIVAYGVAGALGVGAAVTFIVNAVSGPSGTSTAQAGHATVALGHGGALVTYGARF